MGLLDEAIREHLELKRRRGADAGEVSREESEALGPVRRSPDGTPDLSSIPAPLEPPAAAAPLEPSYAEDPPVYEDEPDWGDEHTAHTPPPIPAQPSPPAEPPPSPPSVAAEPPAHRRFAQSEPDPPAAEFDDSVPLPPLDDEPLPEPPREKTRRLPGAGRLRLRRGRGEPESPPAEDGDPDPEGFGALDPPTAAHERPYEPPPVAYQPPSSREPRDDEPAGEDLLEETPEFLEETPDHDRLWFEQRPPRDFDFDK